MKRSSGIIMHIASLSEDYGIGTFGAEAYAFADFLKKTGQHYWQILPLGHTSYGDSPYQAFSAFAGNPYFIDLKFLKRDGLLTDDDFINIDFGKDESVIDYEKLFENRFDVLKIAYERGKIIYKEEIQLFANENNWWLDDYSLYMAVKEYHNKVNWQQWPDDIKLRKDDAMVYYQNLLPEQINFWKFIQYMFSKQWYELKNYVNKLGIEIIGDIPIYVASDSSDVWANTKLFKLAEDNNPLVVAGCPPDEFAETGQLWGNPIYDWDYLEKDEYKWWVKRIQESLKLYDVIRIDHFRGFESFWEVPYADDTAQNGCWRKGPGIKLFDRIKKELGDVPIIAEDLGFLTEEVFKLRDESGCPGMKILQFGFNPWEDSDYVPHKYISNCVVYTGTHDNDTIRGWMEKTGNPDEVEYCKRYLRLTEDEGYNWGFIRGAWSSVADVAITTMQDIMNYGNETRINMPSSMGTNWTWRMKKNVITDDIVNKLYTLTEVYKRII
ncbi:MAG: 4-alpha-glucanotransferase [Cellulosilyticaceae bacterium]